MRLFFHEISGLALHHGRDPATTAAFAPDGHRVFAGWWDWPTVRQYEAFPWREEEYPGSAGEDLQARMHRYAQDCDLRCTPRGRVTFRGVAFDVRGIIQLRRFESRSGPFTAWWGDIPEAVGGIPVGQRFRRLHLLLGTDLPTDQGLAIGTVVLTYSDGSHEESEICYGRHVRTAQAVRDPRATTDQAQVAWEGKAPCRELSVFRSFLMPSTPRVYQTAWENPRPEVEVVSLDLVSKMTASAPCMIAVTVE